MTSEEEDAILFREAQEKRKALIPLFKRQASLDEEEDDLLAKDARKK